MEPSRRPIQRGSAAVIMDRKGRHHSRDIVYPMKVKCNSGCPQQGGAVLSRGVVTSLEDMQRTLETLEEP